MFFRGMDSVKLCKGRTAATTPPPPPQKKHTEAQRRQEGSGALTQGTDQPAVYRDPLPGLVCLGKNFLKE